jgi:hypothetical protein
MCPVYYYNGHTPIDLSNEQIELARMALADEFGDAGYAGADSAAIRVLVREFREYFPTLREALCAVKYVRRTQQERVIDQTYRRDEQLPEEE